MTIMRFFFAVIMVFTLSSVAAKNAGDVSATVKDNQTKQPIAYASVELLTAKDSLVLGCITDSKGYFEVAAPGKATKMRIRYLGYKNVELALKSQESETIYMDANAKELAEVSVSGSARQNKIDRDVFTITRAMRAGTTTSQELLGKLSGVTYNYYDKSISVNGSTKVLILVDGIEKDQQYAKNLSPDRIERVEVIKDPVGIYATDGYSAVINIVLKKDYSGIDASINNTAFFDFVGSNGKSIFLQDYGNLNINYTNKNFNLYTSGSLYSNNFELATGFLKRYGNATSETTPMDLKNPNTVVKTRNEDITLGADYTFAKKHTVSAEFKYSDSYDKNLITYNIINSANNVTSGSSSSVTNGKNNTVNLTSAVTYKGKFDENNTLNAEVRYYRTDGYNYSTFKQDNFFSLSDIDLSGNYLKTNISYNHTFSSKFDANLSYGNVYFSNSNTQNSSTFTRYNYRNRVSLYLNYRPLEKLSTKVGGIVENYTQSYTGNSKNLTAFLPYLNIQYTPNQKFNVVAKYHSNAGYPSIDQLNPFKIAQDSLMYSVGNPDLKTGINQTVGLDINVMNFITLSPFYDFSNSQSASYVSIDPANNKHYLSQTVNIDSYSRFGANLDFTLPLGKRLFWKNRIGWNQSYMAYNSESYKVNNWSLNSNLIYMLQEKGLIAGLIVQKQTFRNVAIQGYNTYGNDLVLAMLRKSFMKDKLNVSLFYAAPIECGLNYKQTNEVTAPGYYQTSYTSLNLIKNMVFVELSYRFTSGKEVKTKQQSSDSELEHKQKSGFGL